MLISTHVAHRIAISIAVLRAANAPLVGCGATVVIASVDGKTSKDACIPLATALLQGMRQRGSAVVR